MISVPSQQFKKCLYQILKDDYELLEYYKTNFTNQRRIKTKISEEILNGYILVNYFKKPKFFKIINISFEMTPKNSTIKIPDKLPNLYKSKILEKVLKENYKVNLTDINQPILFCEKISFYKPNQILPKKKKQENNNKQLYLIVPETAYLMTNEEIEKEEKKMEENKINDIHNTLLNEEKDYKFFDKNNNKLFLNNNQKENLLNHYGNLLDFKFNDKNKFPEIIEIDKIYKFHEENVIQTFNTNLKKNKWIFFYPIIIKTKAKLILNNIFQIAKKENFNIEPPEELISGILGEETKSNDNDMLETLENYLKINSNQIYKYSIIIIIIPEKSDIYDKLKKLTLENGLISQMISLQKPKIFNEKYFKSIFYQIIKKSGNELYKINFNEIPEDTMICGIYINLNNNKLYITTMNSINKSYNQFYLNYNINNGELKNIENYIKELIEYLINDYFSRNDRKLKNNIIYVSSLLNKTNNNSQNNLNEMEKKLNILIGFILNEIKYQFENVNNIKICLISPIYIDCYKEILINDIFNITKGKNRKKNYFIYYNSIKEINKEILEKITYKLSLYFWIDVNFLQPNCLYYAITATKLLQKLDIKDVKDRLKSQSFYI